MSRFRYSDYTEGDRQLLYETTNLTESDIASLEDSLGVLDSELNTSQLLTNIYHELTEGMAEGEKAKEWERLGSNQQLELWATQVEDNLRELKGIAEFTEVQEEAYNNIISILQNL